MRKDIEITCPGAPFWNRIFFFIWDESRGNTKGRMGTGVSVLASFVVEAAMCTLVAVMKRISM